MMSSDNNEIQQHNESDEITTAYIEGYSIDEIVASNDLPEEKVIELLEAGLSEFRTNRLRGQRLKIDDRRIIEFFHNRGFSNYFLANLLNCSKTTIANELKRSNVEDPSDPYYSQVAQDDYNVKNYIELGQKKIKRRKKDEN